MPFGLLFAFVLEGDLDLRAVGEDFAVLQLHIQLEDFRNTEVAQGLGCPLDRGRRGPLPRLGARPDELDDFVDAFCHGVLLSPGRAVRPAGHYGGGQPERSGRRPARFSERVSPTKGKSNRNFGRARWMVIDFYTMITWELATILILVAYILGLMTAIRMLKNVR